MSRYLKQTLDLIFKLDNSEEIVRAYEALKERQRQLATQKLFEFEKGDKVYYGKKRWHGTVTEVGRTMLVIDFGGHGEWRISPLQVKKSETKPRSAAGQENALDSSPASSELAN